jgi:hypothetical protein
LFQEAWHTCNVPGERKDTDTSEEIKTSQVGEQNYLQDPRSQKYQEGTYEENHPEVKLLKAKKRKKLLKTEEMT